jgi:hypothetical protein
MCIVAVPHDRDQTATSDCPAHLVTPQQRHHIALAALAGQPISDLAVQHQVSRKFVYQQLPPERPLPHAAGDASSTPFLLLCYDDEAAWEAAGPRALAEARAEAAALARRLADEGRYLGASPLHPVAMATCVRVRGGRRVISDGPFAETHEVLGGFYLILAEDRDTAVRFAAQHPGARVGTVEVRPVFDVSGLRKSS